MSKNIEIVTTRLSLEHTMSQVSVIIGTKASAALKTGEDNPDINRLLRANNRAKRVLESETATVADLKAAMAELAGTAKIKVTMTTTPTSPTTTTSSTSDKDKSGSGIKKLRKELKQTDTHLRTTWGLGSKVNEHGMPEPEVGSWGQWIQSGVTTHETILHGEDGKGGIVAQVGAHELVLHGEDGKCGLVEDVAANTKRLITVEEKVSKKSWPIDPFWFGISAAAVGVLTFLIATLINKADFGLALLVAAIAGIFFGVVIGAIVNGVKNRTKKEKEKEKDEKSS